jgi:multisubunit Na+/H+ antiporter MnhE subunit
MTPFGRYLAFLGALWAGYLLFVYRASYPEALAGLAAAAIAAVVGVRMMKAGMPALVPGRVWARRLPLVWSGVISGTWLLTRALAFRIVRGREIRGAFRIVSYRRKDARREALDLWSVTVTPNTYALGVDREEGYVLVHQLVPDDGRSVMEMLERE